MKRFFQFALLAVAVAGFVLVTTPAFAVHGGSGQLVCGQCHTIHSSQGGTSDSSMGSSTGSSKLLRVSGLAHELCLTCHADAGNPAADTAFDADNGQSYKPPKVWNATQLWNSGEALDKVGAGGDFRSTFTVNAAGVITAYPAGDDPASNPSLGKGHSIGLVGNITPPGSSATPATVNNFTCTNCHDPHGTRTQPTVDTVAGPNVFRMLLVRPIGADGGTVRETNGVIFNNGGTTSIVSYLGAASQAATGGIAANERGLLPDSQTHVWPVFLSGSHNLYGAGELNSGLTNAVATAAGNSAGMSGWCAQCHDNWHENTTNSATHVNGNKNAASNDWTRHPVNCDLDAADTTDGCLAAAGNGAQILDYTHFDSAVVANKLPRALATAPSLGDSNDGTSKYYGIVDSDRVFCLSCHFAHGGPYYDALKWDYTSAVSSGSQTGKSITSVTGCQQCHNKGN